MVLSILFFEVETQQHFVSSINMFLDKKTMLKIWLNPRLNLIIGRSRNRAQISQCYNFQYPLNCSSVFLYVVVGLPLTALPCVENRQQCYPLLRWRVQYQKNISTILDKCPWDSKSMSAVLCDSQVTFAKAVLTQFIVKRSKKLWVSIMVIVSMLSGGWGRNWGGALLTTIYSLLAVCNIFLPRDIFLLIKDGTKHYTNKLAKEKR